MHRIFGVKEEVIYRDNVGELSKKVQDPVEDDHKLVWIPFEN